MMNLREAAEYSGKHPEWIRRRCQSGEIKHTRVGSVYLIGRAEARRIKKMSMSVGGRPRKVAA